MITPFKSIEITVFENEMKSCTCNNFKYNNIACKHVYLLHRLHAETSRFNENVVSFEQIDSVGQDGMTTNIAAENRVVATEHSSMSPDNQQLKWPIFLLLIALIEKIHTV
ncbi:hypothetical protein BCV72DRAFT_264026 [Rhizopus microsporus var. microsporus]|uniref:SWIM-type domain-containing protein n=2 Tax=Rhizopus microsporus TaxID=58291 RepID=A0A2G4SW68_RHIZD|nr:uncharacterized protein RHIMIDRAFT_313045 [Rhizopus microsporus ATCC 52813]ORE04345.1 hypothetical protein BCV72DRAFT_264026 [Rhizopus microsporus var. microsporus]PHZ13038.1 hypothetical protein RHIMIDRAFT_313045 [Rhizopus microsporus ATCC 52813]